MHNIPVTLKLRLAADRGDVTRAQDLLDKYDFVVHSESKLLPVSTDPVYQIELYELQLAQFLSRRYQAQHFIKKLHVTLTSQGPVQRRFIGFAGLDDLVCVERFTELKTVIDEWYKRRYYSHKIKHGSAASEAYRAGFMEAVLDRYRSSTRHESFYRSILDRVFLRDILTKSRHTLRDQKARSVGLDDGLIADLTTLNLTHAKSICSFEESRASDCSS